MMQSQIIKAEIDSVQKTGNQTELQAAFHLFSQMSDQLEKSYRELEQRVEQLSLELAAANSEKLKQLAEKEKLADRLEALHEAMPAAVIWVNEAHKILSANQSANDIFNKNIVNKNWQQLLQQNFTFDGHELIANDQSVYSYHHQRLDQQQGQVIILTDVTMSRELQQSNYRQQRLAELGEITAGIAHQVRTPLASALLSVGHLSHPSVDESVQQKSVERIKKNLLHLDKFVNDMLLYARDGEFDSNCISMSLLIHNLDVYMQQKHYQNFSYSFQNTPSEDKDIIVTGSGDAILSVLISLLENASQLETASDNIKTEINVTEDEYHCYITVSDNGPGLDQAECEAIFKPFYTTKKNGTGLGLAISRSIIRAHHGQLDVVSEKGKGTRMKIQLNKFKTESFLQSNANKNLQVTAV